MKLPAITLALALLAGCSDSGGVDPEATGSADAAATDAAQAKPSARPSEEPMTAKACIEEFKGSGTGVRGENTRACLVDACEQGDKKSCDLTQSPGGNGEPEEGADQDAEEDPAA